MADQPRPRSRFDKGESDRPQRLRFDRSRSPSSRGASVRARSPVAREASDSPASAEARKSRAAEAAAKAQAAAAKINSQILAKKGIQHVDVPPIRSAVSPPAAVLKAEGDAYQQDGDYIKDIEINDHRNRYLLTKGHVQKRIKEETGADITTRGSYLPDKSMATAANPPLYLHITSTTKEGLEKAVKAIHETLDSELPNLVDERRFRRREPENVERDEFGRRKWPEEKIPVDLEPISGFNLRAQVVGRGGDNVKYIQGETGCKVQIKGRGSGFMEPQSNRESDEPMYLHIAGPVPEKVQQAKQLCEELLEKVRTDYQAFKERPSHGRYGGRGDDGYSHGRSGYGDRNERERSQGYGYGYGGSGSGGNGGNGGYGTPNGQSEVQSPGGAANAQASDYNAQWAAYYASQTPGADPYAAYGGYEAYMNMYYQYYGHSYSGAGQQSAAPPPPPADGTPQGAVPPPPPPSGSPPGGYNAVAPPPGL